MHPLLPSSGLTYNFNPADFKSDEEFTEELLKQPFIYEAPSAWVPRNSFILNPTKEVCIVKTGLNEGISFVINIMHENRNQKKTLQLWDKKWCVGSGNSYGSEWVNTLAEAVQVCLKDRNILPKIQLLPGIIIQTRLFAPSGKKELYPKTETLKKILLEHTRETYIIMDRGHKKRIINKATESYCEEIRQFDTHITKNSNGEISFFPQIRNDSDYGSCFHLCQSVLDLSCLIDLSPRCRKRELEQWDPKTLSNIEHIFLTNIITHSCDGKPTPKSPPTTSWMCYVDLLTYLANIDRTDIQVHINKPYMCSPTTDPQQYLTALKTMEREVKGENLRWAQNLFIELIFHNIKCEDVKRQPPTEDPSWHKFYNNEKYSPDIIVELPGSKRNIQAHKLVLARFSELFEQGVFCSIPIGDTITFPEHNERVIEQFLRVAYGFNPDFTDCSCYDLLSFAHYARSPSFSKFVNEKFDASINTLDIEEFVKIINSGIWGYLPNKSAFFKAVGKQWSTINEVLSEELRDSFREDFLRDWSASL